jgi:hypothetical protein
MDESMCGRKKAGRTSATITSLLSHDDFRPCLGSSIFHHKAASGLHIRFLQMPWSGLLEFIHM